MKTFKPLGLGGTLGMVGLLLVVGLAGGFGAALLSDRLGVGGVIGSVVFLWAVMGVALLISISWWRRLDEAAREAHKWAWYWGGGIGMLVGMTAVLTLSTRDVDISRFVSASESPGDLIGLGMMSILLFQGIGYTLAWGWWWLARMRG